VILMKLSRGSRRGMLALGVAVAAAGLLAAGCSRPHPHPPGPTTTAPAGGGSLNGKWVLVPASLGVPVPAGVSVTAEFGDGRVSGSDGCNSYFAGYTAGPGVAFDVADAIGTTKMACDPERIAVERAYLDLLASATSY
jgi:heat shock protein HslJ